MRQMPGTVAATGTPRWRKFTIDESDFTAAAASEAITLFTLGAGEIIHAVKIKHSTPFTGGTIADFTLEVGISGNSTKYASAFDVFQAASDTTFQITNVFNSEDHGSGTTIEVTARSATDDVLDATAGAAEVWVLVSTAT